MSIIALILAYLLGSIPLEMVMPRIAARVDRIDEILSDPQKRSLVMMGLSGLKGFLAVWLARHLTGDEWSGLAASVLALAGDLFPFWKGARGGRGLETAIGALMGLAMWLGSLALGAWVGIFRVTRNPAIATLVAIGMTPILSMIAGNTVLLFATVSIAALVFWRQKDDLEKLRNRHDNPPPPPAA